MLPTLSLILEEKSYNPNIRFGATHKKIYLLGKNVSETTLKELMSLDTVIEKAEQKIEYLSSDEETRRN